MFVNGDRYAEILWGRQWREQANEPAEEKSPHGYRVSCRVNGRLVNDLIYATEEDAWLKMFAVVVALLEDGARVEAVSLAGATLQHGTEKCVINIVREK